MKKMLAAVAAVVLTAAVAVSMAACGGGATVKIVEIDLSSEQYGVAIQKGNTELKENIDEILERLTGDGIEVGGETVTFDSLYQAEMDALAANEQISIGEVKTSSSNRSEELVVATNAEFAPFEYQKSRKSAYLIFFCCIYIVVRINFCKIYPVSDFSFNFFKNRTQLSARSAPGCEKINSG